MCQRQFHDFLQGNTRAKRDQGTDAMPPKRSNNLGNNNKVSKVELSKPPVTTIAKGR
jgi:hypothetical protein